MNKIKELFQNKEKRIYAMLILFIPIFVVMTFFGFKVYKEAKHILSLAADPSDTTTVVVSNDHKVDSMNYVLRDNETTYQKELFTQLKNAVEKDGASDEEIAKLVAMNHIADFYTWSNKVGQYDVGGLYYVNKLGRENVYQAARDSIYKYLNDYMEQYGSDNLLEVESVSATCRKAGDKYPIVRSEKYDIDEYQVGYKYNTSLYDAWDIDVNWTYVVKETNFQTNKFPTSTKIKVIKNVDDGRFEIVMIGSDLTTAPAPVDVATGEVKGDK